MPAALLLPILLRLAGPLAFIGAVIAAGIMNLSIVIVPLLAAASTATAILIKTVTPSPAAEIKDMLDTNASTEQPSPFKGAGRAFAIRTLGFGMVFGLAALIAALFQTTELEPSIRASDFSFLIIPSAIAFIGAWVSARIGFNQMAGMMGQMQEAFSQLQAGQPNPDAEHGTFTFEGEIIDPEERDS